MEGSYLSRIKNLTKEELFHLEKAQEILDKVIGHKSISIDHIITDLKDLKGSGYLK